jgi:hypothetical protein
MRGVLGQPYIDLDEHLDIAALKGLEQELIEGIVRSGKDVGFYGQGLVLHEKEKGLHDFSYILARLNELPEDREKLRQRFPNPLQLREYLALKYKAVTFGQVISIREPKTLGYDGISYAHTTELTSNAQYFPGLLKFIEALPMKEIGRVAIFLSPSNTGGRVHSDGIPSQRQRKLHEFIWMRPNLDKRFFIYNSQAARKEHVRSHAAFFNSLDPHGSDAMPFQTFSLRVDGFFEDSLRNKLRLDEQQFDMDAPELGQPLL